MRIENSRGWIDVGLKVDPTRWSRWDEIGAVQVAIGRHGAPFLGAGEARSVALALALGPEGSGKAPGTETVDNGRGSLGSGVAWLPVARVAASDVEKPLPRSIGYWAISGDGLRPVLRHRDEVIAVRATVYPPDPPAGPLRIKVRLVAGAVAVGTSTRAPGPVIVRDAWGAILRTFQTLKGGKPRHDRKADESKRKAGPAERGRKATPEAMAADRARKASPEAKARDAARKAASRGEAQARALLADGGAMRA